MVDAVISFVVQGLGDFTIKELAFLGGVRSEVESLRKDLQYMLCFIKDAEAKQVDKDSIRQWVSDIRDLAYDCEDVLAEFRVKVHDEETSQVLEIKKEEASNEHKVVEEGETSRRRKGLFTSIRKKCSSIVTKRSSLKESNLYRKAEEKVSLYYIGKEVEDLKRRLDEVSDRCRKYGLQEIINNWEGENKAFLEFKESRKTTPFSFEENVIGYTDDIRTLLGKLLDTEPRRFVISIWGTGGLGKTTLARKLFHDDEVSSKFHDRAWICVSQDYNVEDLLRRIINSFNFKPTERLEEMREEALKMYLRTRLQESLYLVVIDDVWGKIAWERIIEAFPNNKQGSRVIMTTRKRDVAACANYVHSLRFLSEDESWKLFCVATSEKANETEQMRNFGREMLQKCGGLPLAIVLLGGLLSEKSAQEWRLVRDYIWQHLNRESDNYVKNLLCLSFNDLSHQLKLCYLYLGHFPEDYVIPVEKLIQLWMAEGFIPQEKELMEDVAYYYLNELIKRCLIQKDKTRRERVLTCRMHDLSREFAIEKAEGINLFHIFEVNKSPANCFSKIRRQAFYCGSGNKLQFRHPEVLRSLFFFNFEDAEGDKLLTLCSSFRLLTVLDLPDFFTETMPKELGKLIHLKYLRFTQPMLLDGGDALRFILKLASLQTLKISNSEMHPHLPPEICKLQELRHLIGKFVGYFRIDDLVKLQTLKSIPAMTWMETNPDNLVNLRELHISGYNGGDECEFTFDSIAKLKSLQILRVYLPAYPSSREIPSLQPLSHCQNLVELTLHGKMEKLPEEMPAFLPNLECLELEECKLGVDPMNTLGELQNLKVLKLDRSSYRGETLFCGKGGFPQLEILVIFGRRLRKLEVEDGAMPKLRCFSESIKARNFSIPERLRSLPRANMWEYDSYYLEESRLQSS